MTLTEDPIFLIFQSPLGKDYLNRGMEWEGCIDLGKELSLLHSYLTECWVNIDIKRYREAGLHDLQKTLEQLTEAVQNPTSPLNSAFPSGSLSPISPISDYENNNQTADDSSPTSENAVVANQTYAQTIPAGARSYAMYKASPLVGPNSTPKRPLEQQQSGTNGPMKAPASHLQTDDDYVWYSALDDNLRVRHMGMVVQQNRALKQQHQQQQTAASKNGQKPNTIAGQLVAGNGTESISYVDDHQSDYFSRGVTEEEDDDQSDDFAPGDYRNHPQNGDVGGRSGGQARRRIGSHGSLHGTDAICVVHGVSVHSPNGGGGATVGNGATSSGYQSLNYSTSNSSSPVDSSSSSTGTSSQSSTATKQRKDDAGMQKRAAPLAIANPLYSMQTVPLIQQKAPSYSLPDIHHQAPLLSSSDIVSQQPQRQQNQFYRDHQHGHFNAANGCHLHDGGYHGSPDSSFEEQQQRSAWIFQQNGRPQSQQATPQARVPLSMLSHSLTPQVLQVCLFGYLFWIMAQLCCL